MDLTNAALLSAVVLIAIDWVKNAIPTTLPRPLVQLAVMVAGIAAVFLTSISVWANEQVIGGHALTDLNTGSKIVAGILIGAGASLFDQVRDSVKSIGQNQAKDAAGGALPAPAVAPD